MRRQHKDQRQPIAYKYGQEFLALIDGDPNTKVTVTDIVQKLAFQDEIVQKLVFQDEEGNIVSPDWRFSGGEGYSGEV